MTLYKCEPVDWLWLPRPIRLLLAWITAILFTCTFFVIPIFVFATFPLFLNCPTWYHQAYGTFLFLIVLSYIFPMKEWVQCRKVGQLWYELFDFSCNIDPKDCKEKVLFGDSHQFIVGMHPHGIVPLQAVLWSAYCDQYMRDPDSGKSLYGFGAAADVVMYLPFLRNIMGWLSAGSASYKVLRDGLVDGKVPCVNAAGRKPRHLYLLPGGVAEIFVSTPGRNTIVFQNRKGLCRLSLETGAYLLPTYVFGGTDFFHNLATHDSFLSRLSRSLKMGLVIFWGQFYCPFLPFTPRVSMCISEPIEVTKYEGEKGEGGEKKGKLQIPDDLVDALHDRYIQSIRDLFEKHKAEAGYPEAVLEVI